MLPRWVRTLFPFAAVTTATTADVAALTTALGATSAAPAALLAAGGAGVAVAFWSVLQWCRDQRQAESLHGLVDRLNKQQGDWRRGLKEILHDEGIDINQLDDIAKDNPLAQFALLLIGTREQIDQHLEENERLQYAMARTVETHFGRIAELTERTQEELREIRLQIQNLHQQADQTVVRNMLAEVHEWVRPYPKLQFIEQTYDPTNRPTNPFIHNTQRVPLLGRGREMLEIAEFLRNDQPLRWALLSGEAGLGKSRLAHEACRVARQQGWNSGFLSSASSFDRWDECDLPCDTLMVVDYVAERPQDVARALGALAARANQLSRKMRVLLIERNRNGNWRQEFKTALSSSVSNEVDRTEYQRGPFSADLYPLDDQSLKWIVWDIFFEMYDHFEKRDEQTPDFGDMLKVLHRIDPQPPQYSIHDGRPAWSPRPIYAAMIADVVARIGFDKVREWDGDALLTFILEEEKRHWVRKNKDAPGRAMDERHINALVLATITRGLSFPMDNKNEFLKAFRDEKLLPAFDADSAASDGEQLSRLADFAGSPDDTTPYNQPATISVPPLRPDLLGERLLLDRLAGALALHKGTVTLTIAATERFLAEAWRIAPEEVRAFIVRCVQDFPHHPAVEGLWVQRSEDLDYLEWWSELATALYPLLWDRGQSEAAHQLGCTVEALHERFPKNQRIAGSIINVLNVLGHGLHVNTKYVAAIDVYARAQRISRADFGDDHPFVAVSLTGIGSVLQDQGDLLGALQKFAEAERINRAAFGDDHPFVAVSVNGIGRVLQSQVDLPGALQKFAEAERISRAAFGDDHPEVAAHVNNIGGVLLDQRKLPEALKEFVEAERIWREAFGDSHPSLANAVSNIGSVRHEQGDLPGALTKFEEAERIDRAALGDDHPNVAIRVNNIGGVLQDQGDLPGALEKLEEAERIDRAAFGDNHPNVGIRINNIGGVLQAQGDLASALEKYEEAERIERTALSSDHPSVAVSVNNIGLVLEARGNLPGAMKKYMESERIFRKALGDDHPKVAACMNNIGGVLLAQDDLRGAKDYRTKAFLISLRSLGPQNPDTIKLAVNLNDTGGDSLVIARAVLGAQCAELLRAGVKARHGVDL